MNIKYVSPHEIDRNDWPRVGALLDRVLKRGDHTTESVLAEIIEGTVQLWSVNDLQAVCVTRRHQRPRHRVLCIEWLAGKGFKDWGEALNARLEDFARDTGCDRIEASTARKGFKRWRLPGYTPKYTVYRKDIHSLSTGEGHGSQ